MFDQTSSALRRILEGLTNAPALGPPGQALPWDPKRRGPRSDVCLLACTHAVHLAAAQPGADEEAGDSSGHLSRHRVLSRPGAAARHTCPLLAGGQREHKSRKSWAGVGVTSGSLGRRQGETRRGHLSQRHNLLAVLAQPAWTVSRDAEQGLPLGPCQTLRKGEPRRVRAGVTRQYDFLDSE